jgi:hypothetical protein
LFIWPGFQLLWQENMPGPAPLCSWNVSKNAARKILEPLGSHLSARAAP